MMSDFALTYGALIIALFSLLASCTTLLIAWRALRQWKKKMRFERAEKFYNIFSQLQVYMPTLGIMVLGSMIADFMEPPKKVTSKNRTEKINAVTHEARMQNSPLFQTMKMIGDIWKQAYSAKIIFPEIVEDMAAVENFFCEVNIAYHDFHYIELAMPNGTDIKKQRQKWLEKYEFLLNLESEQIVALKKKLANYY